MEGGAAEVRLVLGGGGGDGMFESEKRLQRLDNIMIIISED